MENMVDKDYRDVSYFVYKIDNTAEERINIKEDDELKVKIRYWGKLKELYPKELVENMATTQDKIISKKEGIGQTYR